MGPSKMVPLRVWCVVLAVGCVVASGCVRRTLTIRSDPPGADLLVNDKYLGHTPFTYDFEWYGWYRISINKPGYDRVDALVRLRAPMHLWIPMDLIMELMPFEVLDAKELSYALHPKQPRTVPAPPVRPDRQDTASEE